MSSVFEAFVIFSAKISSVSIFDFLFLLLADVVPEIGALLFAQVSVLSANDELSSDAEDPEGRDSEVLSPDINKKIEHVKYIVIYRI